MVKQAYYPFGIRAIMRRGDGSFTHRDLFVKAAASNDNMSLDGRTIVEHLDSCPTPVGLRWLRQKTGWKRARVRRALRDATKCGMVASAPCHAWGQSGPASKHLYAPMYRTPREPITCISTVAKPDSTLHENAVEHGVFRHRRGAQAKNPFSASCWTDSQGWRVSMLTRAVLSRECHVFVEDALRCMQDVSEQSIRSALQFADDVLRRLVHLNDADGCECSVVCQRNGELIVASVGDLGVYVGTDRINPRHVTGLNADEKARILACDAKVLSGPGPYANLVGGFFPQSKCLGVRVFSCIDADPFIRTLSHEGRIRISSMRERDDEVSNVLAWGELVVE